MLISKFQRKALTVMSAAFVLLSVGDNKAQAVQVTAVCVPSGATTNPTPTVWLTPITCDVAGKNPSQSGIVGNLTLTQVAGVTPTYTVNANIKAAGEPVGKWKCDIGSTGPGQHGQWAPTQVNLVADSVTFTGYYADSDGRATGSCTVS